MLLNDRIEGRKDMFFTFLYTRAFGFGVQPQE